MDGQMFREPEKTTGIIYSIKYRTQTQLSLCAWISFIIACVFGALFAPDATGTPLSLLFFPFLLISMFCLASSFVLKYDLDYFNHGYRYHSKIFKLFNVDSTKFARFWTGEHSLTSYHVYKKFLNSFGYLCSNDEDYRRVLDIIVSTCRQNDRCFEINECNWKEISMQLKEIGIESNIKAVMSGVPVEDVFV